MHRRKAGGGLVVVVSVQDLIGVDCLHPRAPGREVTRRHALGRFCQLRPGQRLPSLSFTCLYEVIQCTKEAGCPSCQYRHFTFRCSYRFQRSIDSGRFRPESCEHPACPATRNDRGSTIVLRQRNYPHRTAVWRGLRSSCPPRGDGCIETIRKNPDAQDPETGHATLGAVRSTIQHSQGVKLLLLFTSKRGCLVREDCFGADAAGSVTGNHRGAHVRGYRGDALTIRRTVGADMDGQDLSPVCPSEQATSHLVCRATCEPGRLDRTVRNSADTCRSRHPNDRAPGGADSVFGPR